MKARVIATGKIVEVKEEYDLRGPMVQVFYSNEEDPYEVYEKEALDFNINDNIAPTIEYWARLEHQAAIAAMQGLLTHHGVSVNPDWVVEEAEAYAHALVEKMKEERK